MVQRSPDCVKHVHDHFHSGKRRCSAGQMIWTKCCVHVAGRSSLTKLSQVWLGTPPVRPEVRHPPSGLAFQCEGASDEQRPQSRWPAGSAAGVQTVRGCLEDHLVTDLEPCIQNKRAMPCSEGLILDNRDHPTRDVDEHAKAQTRAHVT